MTKILVTGGAGFIGRNLVRVLAGQDDVEIAVFDNESSGDRTAVNFRGVSFVHGDIRNREQVRNAIRDVSIVVNLAAHTNVIQSIEDPSENFDVNVIGTFNLLEEARKANVKTMISASTGGAIIGDATPPMHEDMCARPKSPYGASKLSNEGYMSAYAEPYGMRTVSLRFSNVYGPGSLHKGSVVAHFFKKVLKGETLEVFGDGSQQRDFVYIDDLTNGIIQALGSTEAGVFQFGSGYPTSINQLIEALRLVVGQEYPFDVRYLEARSGEVYLTWSSIQKAEEKLGYTAKTGLHDGLKQTWEWFLSNMPRH